MSETLTVERAVELLKQAVAEKGADYVYGLERRQKRVEQGWAFEALSCHYADYSEYNQHGDPPFGATVTGPGCIVGWVLHKAGLPLEALALLSGSARYLGHYLVGQPVWVVPDAAEVLNAAQSVQDNGGTWGEALTAAREFAGQR